MIVGITVKNHPLSEPALIFLAIHKIDDHKNQGNFIEKRC